MRHSSGCWGPEETYRSYQSVGDFVKTEGEPLISGREMGLLNLGFGKISLWKPCEGRAGEGDQLDLCDRGSPGETREAWSKAEAMRMERRRREK